jgi:hypothetical protein
VSEQTKKKNNKKMIIAIVLVVIVAIALAFYSGIFSLPTGLAAVTSQNTPAQPAATFTTTGNEIIAKELTQNLPYYVDASLEAGRYAVQVTTDNPVWIRVYDQARFDDWQNAGKQGSAKAGTNLGAGDKVTNFIRNFDVNQGEEGKYYLLILGSEKTSIQLKITQILKF